MVAVMQTTGPSLTLRTTAWGAPLAVILSEARDLS